MPKITLHIDDSEIFSTEAGAPADEFEALKTENETLQSQNAALTEELGEMKQANESTRAALEAILGSMGGAPGVIESPPADGFFFAPSDGPLQQAIDAAGEGQTIYLKAGAYAPGLDLSSIVNIGIEAAPGDEASVIIDGFTPAPWSWSQLQEGVYEGSWPGFAGLWQHIDSASDFNTRLAYPAVAMIQGEGGVLKWTDGASLNAGEFFITGDPSKPQTIVVHLAPGQSIDNFVFSPYPRLLWGDANTRGVRLKNLSFRGCANTSFTGALNLPGSNWDLENIRVLFANTIAIELGQGGDKSQMRGQVKESIFKNVSTFAAGQMGFWGAASNCEFHSCGHELSNTKGFDHQWHASNKFENTHNCKFYDFYARNCEGPGIWFDGVYQADGGGNTYNELYSPIVENCVRTGIEFELGSSRNYVKDAVIKGIAERVTNPDNDWNQSTAFIFKADSSHNEIDGAEVSGANHVVTFDNGPHETRGASTNNEVKGVSFEEIKSTPAVFIGDIHENIFRVKE